MGCGCAEKKRRGTIRFTQDPDRPRALPASTRIQDMRRRLCSMCKGHVLDDAGESTLERLYGRYKGVYYCGDPNEPRTDEDPKRFGCGCKIDDRVKWETATCPRDTWGPGKRFASHILAFYTETYGDAHPDLYDFIGPARSKRDGMIDCTGIGDNLVQGVAAQAIAKHKAKDGLRVRFVAVSHRLDWAKLATGGKMEIADYGNPERTRALYNLHSMPIKAVEIDATCRMRKVCRQELIAVEHMVPPELTKSWDVNISEEAHQKAKEFLQHPRREQRPIVALSPWTNASVRQWPIRHWAHLSTLLSEEGFAVCLVDPPKPKSSQVLSDAFPVPKFRSAVPEQIAAFISQVDLVIGNDSGMTHLAGFVGTPAIPICGPTDGKVAFGGWPSVSPIQAPGECTGCLWFQDGGWKPWCGFGCQALNELRPQAVVHRALQIINSPYERERR